MSINVIVTSAREHPVGSRRWVLLNPRTVAAFACGFGALGTGVLLALWWLGGNVVASNPATQNFAVLRQRRPFLGFGE